MSNMLRFYKQLDHFRGDVCPECGSKDVDWSYDMGAAQEFDATGRPTGNITMPTTCYACGLEYSEVYKLIGYRPFEDGENE